MFWKSQKHSKCFIKIWAKALCCCGVLFYQNLYFYYAFPLKWFFNAWRMSDKPMSEIRSGISYKDENWFTPAHMSPGWSICFKLLRSVPKSIPKFRKSEIQSSLSHSLNYKWKVFTKHLYFYSENSTLIRDL